MKKNLAIGIDLGGTNARIALVTKNAKILDLVSISTKEVSKPNLFLNWIKATVEGLLKKHKLSGRDILGVGVGVPGSVDSEKGIVHFLPNIKGWKNVRLKSLINQKLKTKVYLDNDANAMAQAESIFGSAKNQKNAIFLTLGTGIGGGLVINNQLYHGADFSACEIGHMKGGNSKIKCACGSYGCIETEMGNKQLLKKAQKELARKKSPIIKRLMKSEKNQKLRLELLTRACSLGDRYSINFWSEVGESLGVFLAGLSNLLNPNVIVLGGGVMGAGRWILNPLKKSLKLNAFRMASKNLKVLKATFGKDAGIIGAASLVFGGNKK